MNKRPPELPNIEDAALQACLAPLMNAMHPGAANIPTEPSPGMAGSNDNPAPVTGPQETRGFREARGPREAHDGAMADDEAGAFRIMELFLAMTEAELETAAAEFPKQIGGTIARIARIKRRLSDQYDTATTVTALLERAMARAGRHPAPM